MSYVLRTILFLFQVFFLEIISLIYRFWTMGNKNINVINFLSCILIFAFDIFENMINGFAIDFTVCQILLYKILMELLFSLDLILFVTYVTLYYQNV
jgi:hypothetical protein